MDVQIHCQFKHIPSKQVGEQLVSNIDTFVKAQSFDKNGIKRCGEGGNDTIKFSLTRREANTVRDKLAQVLPDDDSSVWFHIISDPFHNLLPLSLQTTDDAFHEGSTFPERRSSPRVDFPALLSPRRPVRRASNQFYSHVSFNNKIVQVSVKLLKRKPDSLHIEFDDFRIIISLDSIQKRNILVNKETPKNGIYILLPLKYAPHIYRLEQSKSDNNNIITKQIRLCGDQDKIYFIRDLKNCSDLVLHFEPSVDMAWSFLNHFLADRPERYEINFSSFKIRDWSKENNKNQRPDPFNYNRASFHDRYNLEMLISLGFVFRDKWAQLTDQELNWNQWDAHDRYALCCYAAERLRQDHGYDLTRTERDYRESRKKLAKSENNANEPIVSIGPRKKLKVAVCTLTPLRYIFQPLDLTTGSRALRNEKFGGPEHFLLVHLRDEDDKQLRVSSKNVQQRLKNSMKNGIKLLNKTFVYMGASTGQMKEMAFWFIDLPSNFKDIKEAHNALGNVSGIKNIATYIARVGQYFSTTWPVDIQLTEVANKNEIRPNGERNYVFRIGDIERNNYCFTDGVGKISWGLAGRIAQRMNISLFCKEDIPSAYQIRVAGCKGMVAIDPDSTLNDYYIHIRKSMEKFQSPDWSLEICEYARPMTLTLNNQVIRLLSDLGNTDSDFIALQNVGFDHWQAPEEQQPSVIDIALQKKVSYSTSKDNLLTNRIPIPPKDGRNLFGVADETGELKYGECFIQYSSLDPANNGQRRLHVLTGTVLVTKNPCVWPGDFRKLTAVRNSRLENCMRDVIVFPVNGERPHSNEISGSDLDGDQYWVYWGNRLKINENVEPLSYEGATKLDVSVITQEIIIEHIVETFGTSGVLGMIANTHTCVADKHVDHAFSKDCKKLAELFAIAVDSPKTGKFIDKSELRPYQKRYCGSWPNFMRKFAEPVYESSSIQEKLFFKAVEKYFEFRYTPISNIIPQRIKPTEGASMSGIADEAFNDWLGGKIFEEKVKQKPHPRKQSVKPEDTDPLIVSPSTPPQKEKKSAAKLPPTTKENSPSVIKKAPEKTSTPPETPVKAAEPKTKKTTQNPPILVNTAASASAASSLSSLMSLNTDQYQADFIIAADTNITAASNVKFSLVTGSLYTVGLDKATSEPDRDQIIKKVSSYMEKQDVFKKNPSAYDPKIHGPLYLMTFYGHIYFHEQKSPPQKFRDLQELVKINHNQLIQFNYADKDSLLDISRASSSLSATNKNTMDYEFDCLVPSYPSYCVTLLYNTAKTLRKVRLYRVWTKCYVRQPNLVADSLYEIRSVLTYDSDSPEFLEIIRSVFNDPQETSLLSGRKPKIQINANILQPSVTRVSLKIVDEDRPTDVYQSTVDAFYRAVIYVPINEQKTNPFTTMEYHVSPISKDKTLLDRICDCAFTPTEKASFDRQNSSLSTASANSNSLFGFSMFTNN